MARYFRLRAKGELSEDEVRAALPQGVVHLLRVDRERGETRIYFAASDQDAAESGTARAAADVEDVSLDEITREA